MANGHKNWRLLSVYKSGRTRGISPSIKFPSPAGTFTDECKHSRLFSIHENQTKLEPPWNYLIERIGAKCAAARRALSASFVFYNCGEKRDVSEINRVFLVFSICKLSRHCLPTHRNFFCSGLDKSDRSRCTGNTLAISQFSLMHTILYIFFNITFVIIAKFHAEICIYPE